MRIIYLGFNAIGKKIYDWLLHNGENIVSSIETKDQLAKVYDLEPDLIISGGFRHIISQDILKIPRYGCINFHKSYLPYNRGANPNVWSIIENNFAGVSIHYMDTGIDTGPILAQKKVDVEFTDNAKSLYKKLEHAQFDLFVEFWPNFKSGNIEAQPQIEAGTYHKVDDFNKIREIDLNSQYNALDFINLLRALTFPPFKNCYTTIDGKKYFLEITITSAEDIEQDNYEHTHMIKKYK
ncbi:MAG: methionyl-tRNA formyltransferase [archaeon]